ncbi:MAG: hypothetical protein JXN60_06430, partial [Lentisphaerae bacterium]|nr:hypothetical protein [Lentisphaerota bacterium]
MRSILLACILVTSLGCFIAVPTYAQEATETQTGYRSTRGRIVDLENQTAALKKEIEALKAQIAKL